MGQLRHMGPADGLHHDPAAAPQFRCCEGARIRQVEFQVDPVDPRFMVDGTGRRIRYLG